MPAHERFTMDIYRTPDERFRDLPGYPFAPRYVEVNGLRLHFVDEGQGDPVLMLHGEPTWSFLYRKMIPPIAAEHRAVAPDYIGFGKSDKPIDDAYYTFANHYANLEAIITALDLSRITLVMQDWGGPLGLRFATQHPEWVARLVLLNTGLLSGSEESFTPGLRRWIERSQQVLEGSIGDMMSRGGSMSPEVARGYDAPFPTRESKAGARRFPLMIPHSPSDPGGPEMLETRTALGRWSKPSLVMFGQNDRVFPPPVAEGLARLIPGAEGPVLIEGAGHFVQEEAGEELARRILAFMQRT